MCVHLEEYKVSYFAVPKCACTSLKTMFFEVENGFAWRNYVANSKKIWVHNAYPSLPFEKARKQSAPGFWKFAVLRSPVERLVSCYRNRLMRGRGRQQLLARAGELEARGLSRTPDFAGFMEHFDDYCDLSPDVKAHSRPLSFFLGTDPGYFDRLFRLSELAEVMAELRQRITKLPELLHLQTRGADVQIGKVHSRTEQQIRKLFDEDYRLFGAHF